MKKPLILFLALLFPVCIFVFLKFFGKNQFDVAPLFETEFPEDMHDCTDSLELPYKIAKRFHSQFSLPTQELTLVYTLDATEEISKVLNKVKREFGERVNHQQIVLSSDIRCALLLKDELDMVLIDKSGSIRGQYKSTDRDEVDRMMMELSILFKEY